MWECDLLMRAITGGDINYYFVCQRKLWLSTHQVRFEAENERVQLGSVLDQESYQREHHQRMIDGVVAIDFIQNWKIVHEVKQSRAIEKASEFQLKYYMYYLKKKGIAIDQGVLDYPKLKERIELQLTPEDELEIDQVLHVIKTIINQDEMPPRTKKNICRSCAYQEFCFS